MCEIGRALLTARKETGRSIREWARELNIKSDYLFALEECRFEDLPEAVLAKGHLRRYAEALGLDPEPLLAQYPTRPTLAPLDVTTPAKRSPQFSWWPILLLLFALIAGLGWWLLTRPQTPPQPEIELSQPPPPPPPPEESVLKLTTKPEGAVVWLDGFRLGKTPLSGSFSAGVRRLKIEAEGYSTYQQIIKLEPGRELDLKITLTPLPKEETSIPTGPPKVTFRYSERAWVRITTPDGHKLYEGIPQVGSEQTYELPVIIRTGNAAGVRVILNGQDEGPLGGEGLVVERRFEIPTESP